LAAVAILALNDAALSERLQQYRRQQTEAAQAMKLPT
jgi:phosphoribosylcarboxyaminoimidazole (NCAIR) mutase